MSNSFFQGLADAEIAILKGPLVTFLTSLQSPNVNFLTVVNDFTNLQLQLPVLSLPLQTTLINFTSAALLAKLNSIGAPAPVVAPAA